MEPVVVDPPPIKLTPNRPEPAVLLHTAVADWPAGIEFPPFVKFIVPILQLVVMTPPDGFVILLVIAVATPVPSFLTTRMMVPFAPVKLLGLQLLAVPSTLRTTDVLEVKTPEIKR